MKKLLAAAAVVFLGIFTAGLASAALTFPITFDQGALYFINVSGGTATITTDNGTGNAPPGQATITLNQEVGTSPEPTFYFGTLATNLGSTATTPPVYTFNFTAILDKDCKLRITGTDASGDLLRATAGFGPAGFDKFECHHKWKKCLPLQGAIILAPGTTSASNYSFEGKLSPSE